MFLLLWKILLKSKFHYLQLMSRKILLYFSILNLILRLALVKFRYNFIWLTISLDPHIHVLRLVNVFSRSPSSNVYILMIINLVVWCIIISKNPWCVQWTSIILDLNIWARFYLHYHLLNFDLITIVIISVFFSSSFCFIFLPITNLFMLLLFFMIIFFILIIFII